jgi:16S rRNA (uracil1498-N3)-methyltransferase
MRIPRIFTPQDLNIHSTIELEEAPSHHLNKVLRMQVGRELIVFNGLGGEYLSTIESMTKKNVCVMLTQFNAENRESPLDLELAIGISRGDRMEWVLQKATELGVTTITPLVTERTEVKLSSERADKKMERWQQTIISACEQCQRNMLPRLNTPILVNDWVAQCNAELKCVLHHREHKGFPQNKKITSVALLIGPEGGLSEAEINGAIQQEFLPLTLGPRVLRTETAPVAAISLVQYLWGDF